MNRALRPDLMNKAMLSSFKQSCVQYIGGNYAAMIQSYLQSYCYEKSGQPIKAVEVIVIITIIHHQQ
jgi:hypothetical protein